MGSHFAKIIYKWDKMVNIKEMQIKTTVRYYYTPHKITRLGKTKHQMLARIQHNYNYC